MNPAKRKRIHRAELVKQNSMSASAIATSVVADKVLEQEIKPAAAILSAPVVIEPVVPVQPEPVLNVPVTTEIKEEPKLGLQEILKEEKQTKEELVTSEMSVATVETVVPVTQSSVPSTNTKKKKV